jgi:monoamine oxidase
VLRQPLWEHRLLLGSSETAAHDGGHLEGALEAARRLLLQLGTLEPAHGHAASPDAGDAPMAAGRPALPAAASTNSASLAQFRLWVRTQQQPAFEGYRRRINHSLATQEREQLAQRAMLATMEEVFGDALARLETLPFDTGDVAIERGRSALTPQVQAAFQGFIQNLLDEVVAFNRTSCALSNFPDEHQLSKEYEQTILRDIAAAWRDFSLSANSFLLSADAAMTPRPGHTDLPRGVAP